MKRLNLATISLLGICFAAAGVLSGIFISGMNSQTAKQTQPTIARANTSDRVDGYLTCTGYVDVGIEALYLLDSSTGLLRAGVLSKNPQSPGFQAMYQGNVNMDLEKIIRMASKMGSTSKKSSTKKSSSSRSKKNQNMNNENMGNTMMPSEPKYIMTAGVHDMPGSGIRQPGSSALYVTEVNTGITLVYILPWSSSAHSSNTPVQEPISYFTFYRFLVPMIMEESVDEE
ncbi:MAG: hypothetical protein E7028_04345 [Planctomycetaceae bacterium]|nr:hypothetical protein [Planctomycetaceae bacterium]MDO4424424.1 hypothetical protein [Planctomycetia bacterium]